MKLLHLLVRDVFPGSSLPTHLSPNSSPAPPRVSSLVECLVLPPLSPAVQVLVDSPIIWFQATAKVLYDTSNREVHN